ncbi:MAG: CsgG/HfaB family protein [Treponema sp.]|jgi:hypothetical protein|nr:CsgG/HfaB family protein [Treponema sp.]
MKKLFPGILCLIAVSAYAQQGQRLMEIPAKQLPVQGQSVYAFTVTMRSGKSVLITVDDRKIGHFFNGESAEITVPNGRHVVRAYQMEWETRPGRWKDDDDDRLTDTLNGERVEVEVAPGPKLRRGRKTKADYDALPNQNAARQASSLVTGQPAKPGAPAAGATGQPARTGIEGAVVRASAIFIRDLPRDSTIAVISISSKDYDTATFAIDELEYQLVMAKLFTIVDRKTLDAIRTEQHFQLSGEVSDESAVSIGNLLGAGIVITGAITGTGTIQRLTLKALNVKTAQILAMAREAF